ncbi:MAG: alpha/beta hydrolase [Bacilli bacterium]|nr:alpha/beta hydrolase [Bacilli bacterium]
MEWWLIVLICLVALILVASIVTGFIGFKIVFRRTKLLTPYDVDEKSPHYAHRAELIKNYEAYLKLQHQDYTITNEKGQHLKGYLIKCSHPTEKLIIFSHGWHSNGAVDNAFTNLWMYQDADVLVIDHVGHGASDGNTIGFGLLDSRNLQLWVKKMNEVYHHHVKIILYGLSMGANATLLNSNKKMENVKGLIADCGYTSNYDIIYKLVKSKYLMFWIGLVVRLCWGHSLKEESTLTNLKHSLYPVLFIHGKADGFVPTKMSVDNYEACSSKKEIVLIDGANHALSCLTDPSIYEAAVKKFVNECTK